MVERETPEGRPRGLGSGLHLLKVVQGQIEAQIIKAKLESEGIPVLLSYESAGVVYGLTLDGLGEVHILVPEECLARAKALIHPQ